MANFTRADLTTILLTGLGIFILSPMLMMGFALSMADRMDDYGVGGSAGIVGTLVPLAALFVILGIRQLLVRRVTDHTTTRDPAMKELRSANARGDPCDEEFETRRKKLKHNWYLHAT